MKKILLLSTMLFFITGFSQTKTEKIKELSKLTGVSFFSDDLKEQFMAQFKKSYPNVSESSWNDISKKIDVQSLINQTFSLYEKYYTDKEIDQLLSFYKSPLGKKMLTNMPKILQDGQTIGRNWGMETAKLINAELEKLGYLQSPPPPSN